MTQCDLYDSFVVYYNSGAGIESYTFNFFVILKPSKHHWQEMLLFTFV